MKKSFVATLVCAASAFMLLTAGMSYAAEDAPKVSTTFCNMLATDHPQSVAAANVLAKEIAEKTKEELIRQSATLSRKEIIEASLRDFGGIIVCKSKEDAVYLANEVAPEHLEVAFENPLEYIGKIDNAGSVFLGQFAPEPLGDYFAGPNHVLPTGGTARFFSPLGVDAFVKRSSFIYYTKDALAEAKDEIELLAKKEGLTAHANSIHVRFEEA